MLDKAKTIQNTMQQMIDRVHASTKPTRESIGRVVASADGVVTIAGLHRVPMCGCIEFENGEQAMTFSLQNDDELTAVVLGNADTVSAGMVARLAGDALMVPVGKGLLGRIVDGLGRPIDGKGALTDVTMVPCEAEAPAIAHRCPVSEPYHTGIKIIDTMIPIGCGQRELIIGDRGTGKTTIAIDAMIHQHKIKSGVVGIYVAIGQKLAAVRALVDTLERHGALSQSIVVVASASDSAAIQTMAPLVGCTMGEYFMNNSCHAAIVYDDLSKHAEAYRQISLLLRRPPGREAYPGDAFYVHARLLERGAKLSKERGGGSMTALPIIETRGGDITTFIATNVISITDGQIFLDSKKFNEGKRPAIDIGLSVSRVGSSAQWDITKEIGKMKVKLAQYKELAEFSKFATNLDDKTKANLEQYHVLEALLEQGPYQPLPQELQCLLFAAHRLGVFTKEFIRQEIKEFVDTVNVHGLVLLRSIRTKRKLDDEDNKAFHELLRTFKYKMIESMDPQERRKKYGLGQTVDMPWEGGA